MTDLHEAEINWEDLLLDIEEQNAVLLLGHGFLPGAQGALLQEKLGEKLLHAYGREGLFLFADSEAKTRAQKEAARFYRGQSLDGGLLKQIAEMPFPLMVSANPDTLLLDTFAQYQVPCQFDYFSSRYKVREYAIQRPKVQQPLLYNLCGSHEDRESLLLDYDDLFLMLSKLLGGETPLPNNEVRMPLYRATSFIFLGFHFERWYTQLFMRYLNMNESRFSNPKSNYALKTTFVNEDAQAFFWEQFNVKFIGADWGFFHEPHRRFREKFPDKLRKLVDVLSPTATTVVQLIEKADFPAAFQMLDIFKGQFDKEDNDLLITLKSRYSGYEQQKREGTADSRDLSVELANIRQGLLHLAQQLT